MVGFAVETEMTLRVANPLIVLFNSLVSTRSYITQNIDTVPHENKSGLHTISCIHHRTQITEVITSKLLEVLLSEDNCTF